MRETDRVNSGCFAPCRYLAIFIAKTGYNVILLDKNMFVLVQSWLNVSMR